MMTYIDVRGRSASMRADEAHQEGLGLGACLDVALTHFQGTEIGRVGRY